MAVKTDIRQIQSIQDRDNLSQLGMGTDNIELDNIVRGADSEVTMPLRLRQNETPDLIVNIDAINVSNPNTLRNRTIPPISSLLPTFSGATITLDSTGVGDATPSVGSALALGMTASQYLRLGINIDATGNLTLTKGSPGASLSTATTPPIVSGLFAIGHIIVRTDSSNNVQNILGSDIYQYIGGGGGGSGSGTGNPILETLKNELIDSPYQLVTPNIIATSGQALISSLSGASYDLITNTIKFSDDDQVMTSTQLLDDDEFLSSGLDISSVDLSMFWNKGTNLQALSIPTDFVYEISRDGGTNWFAITMNRIGNTDTFYGNLLFDTSTTTEATKQQIINQASQDASTTLDITNNQRISQAFTLTATTKLQEVSLSLAKGAGTPVGSLFVSIIKDNAGSPSISTSDVLSISNAISVSGLSLTTTQTSHILDIPDIVLVAGTYHVVVSTDASYKSGYSASNSVILGTKSTGASAPFIKTYNGSAYSTGSTNLTYKINGRVLDLRVRVASDGAPTYPCGLDAFGIFYDLENSSVVSGVNKRQQFVFNSVSDNLNIFTISSFNPDVDLLTCYHVGTGQVYKSPAFSLSGNVVTFPADTFYNNGVSTTVNLIFDQNTGSSFDSADSNARLLANNHLGSNSASDDRSVSGRGVLLRDSAGTLKELSIGHIPGTPTNDDALSGEVGEYFIQSRVSSASIQPATNTATNVTATPLTLPAGDWDISATLGIVTGTTTVMTAATACVSLTSATIPSNSDSLNVPSAEGEIQIPLAFPSGTIASQRLSITVPTYRVSLSATTTFYLVGQQIFTTATPHVYGSIWARRAR